MANTLSPRDRKNLNVFLGGNKSFNLLYKASRDGCSAEAFHEKCDNKGPTVTVIYKNNGFTVGGYTAKNWDSNSKSKRDPDAFLFRLTENTSLKPKYYPVKDECCSNCIYCGRDNGPVFGSPSELPSFTGTITAVGGIYTLNMKIETFGDTFNNSGDNRASFDGFATQAHDIEVYRVAEAKEMLKTFGTENTAVLMVGGSGDGVETFTRDVRRMEELLKSEQIGINKDKIYTCFTSHVPGGKVIEIIKYFVTKDIIPVFEKSKDGCFVFYYSGHFRKNTFLFDGPGDQSKDKSTDTELANVLGKVPAGYYLLILDMCFSGSAEIGAKGVNTCTVQSKPKPPIPLLIDALVKGKHSNTSVADKIVQWSSSTADQESGYDKANSQSLSFFTEAIIDQITSKDSKLYKDIGEGGHASVLKVNEHLAIESEDAQTPIIKPQYANEDYFEEYPFFAKMI